jgi:hypothetical protein
MFARLLEQISLGLEKHRIAYMVIGGQAVLLYGEPRLTRDIDVTLGAGPERLADLLELVKGWGWRVLVEEARDFVEKTMVLPCLDSESGIRIDFIFSHSAYERQAMDRVRCVSLGKAAVRCANYSPQESSPRLGIRPPLVEGVREQPGRKLPPKIRRAIAVLGVNTQRILTQLGEEPPRAPLLGKRGGLPLLQITILSLPAGFQGAVLG